MVLVSGLGLGTSGLGLESPDLGMCLGAALSFDIDNYTS